MDSSYPESGEWAPIPGFAGYAGSSRGQILNVNKGKLKKLRRAGNGALQVDIGKSTCMVHDLIARAFYGHPTTRGYRPRHLNRDLGDNRPCNLVWSGRPITKQPAPLAYALEAEYLRVRSDREALLELMQT